MRSFFSRKLYVEGLKRIKLAGIAAAIAVILLNAIIPITSILENKTNIGVERTVVSVEPIGFIPAGFLMLAFGAVFAYSMFSFLNERNRSDFFHAIPEKRICVYLSFIAAMLTWIFGILAVSTGVNAILFGFAKYSSVNLSVIFVTPLVIFIASAMIASFMTLAMTLTGTVISNMLIFVLFLLFGRTIGQIFVTCLREIAPIIASGNSFLNYLEFNFSLPIAFITGEGFTNKPLILYTAIVTLLVFAFAGICYVRRKSESAARSAPSKRLQHVYRTAISLPFFLFIVLNWITGGSDAALTLVLLILAILVYCIFELMTTKKLKALTKALPMIFIPILLAGVFTGAVFLSRNIILNQVPSLVEVEAVGKESTIWYRNPSYSDLRTKKVFVDAEEAKEIVLHALEREVEMIREDTRAPIRDEGGKYVDFYTKLTVQIKLKNGKILSRYISMTEKEYERFTMLMFGSEDYLEAYLELPKEREINTLGIDADLDKNDIKRLWASFVLEFNSLSKEEKLAYVNKSYYNESVGTIHVSGTYRLKSFDSGYHIVYQYMPKTAWMYLTMVAEEGTVDSDLRLLERIKEDISKAEDFKECYFDLEAIQLSGDNAGDTFSVNSAKTDIELSVETALQLVNLILEKGSTSYEPEGIIVRFRVSFYGMIRYQEEVNAEIYSSPLQETVIDENYWVNNLFLSFDVAEWEEFKEIAEPYWYHYVETLGIIH